MPVYSLQQGQTKEDIKGMTLGKQEFSVSPRLVVEMHVQKEKPAVITATIKVPCKFQCGGLVDRK